MPSRKDDIIGITKSGKWDKEYPTCNKFVCDVSKRFFGMDIPKVGAGEFANNPIGAIHMNKYLGGRSSEANTGVEKVDIETARKLANKGDLVYVAGMGHLSIAAPSDKSFKMFRPSVDAKEEPLIGVKNPKAWNFYHVNVPKYKQYDANSPDEYKGDFVTRRAEIEYYNSMTKKSPALEKLFAKDRSDAIAATYNSEVDVDSFVGTPEWRNERSQQAQIGELIR